MDKKEKQKEAYIKWRDANRAKYLQMQNELAKKYYENNKEKVLEKKKEYYVKNRVTILEKAKQKYINIKLQNDLKTID